MEQLHCQDTQIFNYHFEDSGKRKSAIVIRISNDSNLMCIKACFFLGHNLANVFFIFLVSLKMSAQNNFLNINIFSMLNIFLSK